MAKYISWFRDIGLDDRPKVGGKGGSLGELQRAGIDVPPGFVVRTEAFEDFIDALERHSPVRARVEGLAADELEGIGAVSRELRTRIEDAPLSAELLQEIGAAYRGLGEAGLPPAVAVRSSATTEDAADASFAGLQDTYLWVTQADSVVRKIRSCWASLYSLESLSYRRRLGIAESTVAMAVVVQTMVDARTAGVMFTRSPISGDRSVITIEGAWGLGSALVSGEVTPDRWAVSRSLLWRNRCAANPAFRTRSCSRCAPSADRLSATTAGHRTSSGPLTGTRSRSCCCRVGPRRFGRTRTIKPLRRA